MIQKNTRKTTFTVKVNQNTTKKKHVPVKTGKIKMRTVIKVSDGRKLMPILSGCEKNRIRHFSAATKQP